jgi:hypothetical protein
MRRTVLLALVVLPAVATAGTRAAEGGDLLATRVVGPPVPKQEPVGLVFFGNRSVPYWNFGPIKLRSGNKVGTIWEFPEGPRGQLPVVAAIPGQKKYSALVRITRVTWKDRGNARILRSAGTIARARAAGDVTLTRTNTVLNAPLIGFGQKAHPGFSRGEVIHYYELGVTKVAAGNEVLPIWTFTNGPPGQRNIADVVPGATDYPPLWQVIEATWKAGANRRVLQSHTELQKAIDANELTLRRTSIVVNCPLV